MPLPPKFTTRRNRKYGLGFGVVLQNIYIYTDVYFAIMIVLININIIIIIYKSVLIRSSGFGGLLGLGGLSA